MKTAISQIFNLPHQRARGITSALTMVEMMVSLFIFLGVATSLLYGFTISRRTAESTIVHSITTDVAQSFLEQIKTMNYGELQEIIANPTTKPLRTYRPAVTAGSSSIVSFPLYINKDTDVPVTLDIRPGKVESAFTMTVRPKLRDLGASGSNPLPAIEVTIEYSYTSNTRPGGTLVSGRRVQYVIPRLGGNV